MDLSPVRRSTDGAVVTGLCASLARRWHLDPIVLRVALVVLSLFAGLGVAVYVGAVLLVPKEGSGEFPVRDVLPFTRTWSAPAVIGSVVGLGLLIMATLGGLSPLGIGPAIGLGFLWYFGFHRNRPAASTQPHRSTGSPAALPTGTDFERAAATWQARVAEHRAQSSLMFPGPAENAPSQVPPLQFFGAPTPSDPPASLVHFAPAAVEHRRHRATSPGWVWPLTLLMIGLSLAALVLLGAATPAIFWAVALGWVAVALVVSAFVGRPRWLLASGLALALAMTLSLAPVQRIRDLSVGEQAWTYVTAAELPASRTLDAGEVVIDLSKLTLTTDTTVDFRLRAGTMRVVLPAGTTTDVTWSVNAGSVQSELMMGDGDVHDGLNLSGGFADAVASGPTLHLNLHVDLGELVVRR